jgi:hypothetical protein
MSPAVTADVLPDLDALPTRILQTIFGFGLLLRATVQSLAFLAAGGEDPEVDYRPRTKPAVATDEASMRVLLQAVSFGIGALLMAYVLAPGLLEAPWLRFAQAFWMLQAGVLMFTTVIDWLKT